MLAEHQAQATAVRAWLAEALLSEAVVRDAAKAVARVSTPYVEDQATAALQAAVDVLGVRGE